jgi:ABC-type antimicrobial peptide transport system permease subunit
VIGRVLADAVKLVSWGVAAGLALAYVFAREFSWSAFGALEAAAYAVAVAITVGIAVVAAFPAARRAAAVEPTTAMRAE